MPSRRGPSARLIVEVVTPRAFPVPGLAAWLERVAPARARGQVTVGLVSDREIARLNRTFLGHRRPTDVLSFPAARGAERLPRGTKTPPHLGDVLIARGVAGRQAKRAGHSLATELRVLALHGLLHLLGYDHQHDDGQMARLEQRLRRKGGLVEGLIERATPVAHGTRLRRGRAR